jgi:hypothetical protein
MRTRGRPRRFAGLALAGVALVASCDSPAEPGIPPPQLITRIEVEGARMAPGSTMQLTAIGYTSNDVRRDITSEVSWSSSQPEVVRLVAGGQATAGQTGEAQVTASYGTTHGTARVLVLPEGTFRVAGKVLDEGRPVPFATVSAVGNATTVSAVTTATGDYALYGVGGSVEIRAQSEGFRPANRPLVISQDLTLDIELVPEDPRPSYRGRYQLTIAAGTCNTPPPEEFRTRTYLAEVEQTSNQLSFTLRGTGTMHRGAFAAVLDNDAVKFVLNDGFYYYSYRFGARYDLVEQIGDRVVVMTGSAHLTKRSDALEGMLDGWFMVFDSLPPFPGRLSWPCQGRHAVRLVRLSD